MPHVAIACGGTGGHLFPGLAVARLLCAQGCRVTGLISPKEVDQEAVKTAGGLEIAVLPAVGLMRGKGVASFRGFIQSYRMARRLFQNRPPQAVLAMGGFTSAPPILAAKRLGARTFLHESNTVPGRANRWLSWFVDEAFIGFRSAAARLHTRRVKFTGTPVRSEFVGQEAGPSRRALGFDPARPVVVVMGGSQGATGINDLVINSLPLFARSAPRWQWFHLTGSPDLDRVQTAYSVHGLEARVYPFFARMDLVLGAASAAISRSGASSLAELAAARVPAVLVPYPAATDDHQFFNARAYTSSQAALTLDQKTATPEMVLAMIQELVGDQTKRAKMQAALGQWHAPSAARLIAESILEKAGIQPVSLEGPGGKPGAGELLPETPRPTAQRSEALA